MVSGLMARNSRAGSEHCCFASARPCLFVQSCLSSLHIPDVLCGGLVRNVLRIQEEGGSVGPWDITASLGHWLCAGGIIMLFQSMILSKSLCLNSKRISWASRSRSLRERLDFG